MAKTARPAVTERPKLQRYLERPLFAALTGRSSGEQSLVRVTTRGRTYSARHSPLFANYDNKVVAFPLTPLGPQLPVRFLNCDHIVEHRFCCSCCGRRETSIDKMRRDQRVNLIIGWLTPQRFKMKFLKDHLCDRDRIEPTW